MRIVHVTSAHPWYDVRIFHKMCRSLVQAGHEVHLVVPENGAPMSRVADEVRIHAVRPSKSRLGRMSMTARAVLRRAGAVPADCYHLHDPELLIHAVSFQRRTDKPVLYDAHEDLRLQTRNKRWIPWPIRPLVSRLAGRVEDCCARSMAGVVAATPAIARRFAAHPRCTVVQNFPRLDEFEAPREAGNAGTGRFVYVGGLEEIRGIGEMIGAVSLGDPNVRLVLAGTWENPALRSRCTHQPGWSRVEDHGFLERPALGNLISTSQAGLVLLHPRPNYLEAYPIKMFEYMGAGLPVIASDFPLWRSIIEEAKCGLLVDPLDQQAIAEAMRWVVTHPDEARAMGRRGREAVEKKYNWEQEFPKLLNLCRSLRRP